MTAQATLTRDNLVKILDSEIAAQLQMLDTMRECSRRLQSVDVSANDAETQIIAIATSLYQAAGRAI